MTINDWGVIIALVISSAALALELRRWAESKPKLKLSVMASMRTFPDDDGQKKLSLTVVNRGSMSTTITHMIGFTSPSKFHRHFGFQRGWWHKMFPKYTATGLVGQHPLSSPVPHEIGTNQSWRGVMVYDDETLEARKKGQLYVGVYASHTEKEYLIRVREPAEIREDEEQS